MKFRIIIPAAVILIYSCVSSTSLFAKPINSIPMQKSFVYNGRDPFLNLEKLSKLSNEKKSVESNVNKNEITARIRSISVLGLMVGKLGKRALISSNGNINIVEVGEKIGKNAKVVDIGDSSITIKGTYKEKGNMASVLLKLKLNAP